MFPSKTFCYVRQPKESVLLGPGISLKSFVKKQNFQTVIFEINFVIINRHTCKLFQNILNDFQFKGNEEIISVLQT